jgi:hypothetical protein
VTPGEDVAGIVVVNVGVVADTVMNGSLSFRFPLRRVVICFTSLCRSPRLLIPISWESDCSLIRGSRSKGPSISCSVIGCMNEMKVWVQVDISKQSRRLSPYKVGQVVEMKATFKYCCNLPKAQCRDPIFNVLYCPSHGVIR